MYTSSLSSPLRNALRTSSCRICQPLETAIERAIRILRWCQMQSANIGVVFLIVPLRLKLFQQYGDNVFEHPHFAHVCEDIEFYD